ncbi:hypothetical protein LQW54_002400 [Pestalotiopsis sp. IQ-011]
MTVEAGLVTEAKPAQSPTSESLGEVKVEAAVTVDCDRATDDSDAASAHSSLRPAPLEWKLAAIVLVTAIGFGSQWSSGITGAMKTTIKKELDIDNTQFALLEASEDFMVTALMLVSGIVTDRIGGAGAMFRVGTNALVQVHGRRPRRAGPGDIATQVAQYKVFSAWFAPDNGFASTLGFELGIGKIGAFAGKSSANIISTRIGLAWVFWVAVFMNIFTNVMTGVFYWFTKVANRKFHGVKDPSTGQILKEKSKKFEIRKVVELPNVTGAAASLGVFAFAYCFGPSTIIDSIRTSIWDPSVFGSAYALKITMNNAMNIVVRVITGVIQDRDNNSCNHVVIVYAILAGISVVVSVILVITARLTVDLVHLQWTRKQRMARTAVLQERRRQFVEENGSRNRKISMACFGACILLIIGSWCGYFWGVATGNNE